LRYPYLRDLENGDVDLEITAQGLCFVNDAGRSATVDWLQIRQVRLYWNQVATKAPSGVLDEQCQWLDCNADYREFVLFLHDRLRINRSRARFRRGLTWLGFLNYAFGTSWMRGADVSVPGFSLLIPTDWPILARHFPRRYRPDQLPQSLLPAS
jgi:hypothetical protein